MLDEMHKDSFTLARGVILRSDWNQEVLSVSVNQGAAKWLKPSISALSECTEILLHDS